MRTDVVVVGSLNFDISIRSPRLPRPGETLIGTEHFTGPGGKGANQAVAAARLGSAVTMVGRVGDDRQGEGLVAGVAGEGVDVEAVGIDPEAGTGIAVITIDDRAENTIVVSPGANMKLEPSWISKHIGLLAEAKVVLAQLEIPLETVIAAAGACEGIFCLNSAPARDLPSELLGQVDVLIANRTELAELAGVPMPGPAAEVMAAVEALAFEGAVIVTLGAGGAFVSMARGESFVVPPPAVEAVDPTGAGDAFCGALAHRLAEGDSLEGAVGWAVAAGAVAVTRFGAQAAMPSSEEVEALLGA